MFDSVEHLGASIDVFFVTFEVHVMVHGVLNFQFFLDEIKLAIKGKFSAFPPICGLTVILPHCGSLTMHSPDFLRPIQHARERLSKLSCAWFVGYRFPLPVPIDATFFRHLWLL